MALTKVGKEGITGISNASDGTAITIDASENVGIGTTSTSSIRLQAVTPTANNVGLQVENSNTADSFGIVVKGGNDANDYTADFRKRDNTNIMRIRGDGNVGIGTTSPAHNLEIVSTASGSVNDTLQIRNNATASGTGSRIRFINSTDANSDTNGASIASIRTGNDNDLTFETENVERMRITSAGKMGFGTSTQILNGGGALASFTFGGAQGVFISTVSQSGGECMGFVHQGSSVVGTIAITSSATSFNTSSDYRLKENVNYTWDATTRLKQLKPAQFNWIADDTNTLVDGFLAHEVSSVVPQAITKTKDAMTAEVLYEEGDELPEGKSIGDVKQESVPDYQGIDQSKLVPLLVKALQEQQTVIESLTTRITALEA